MCGDLARLSANLSLMWACVLNPSGARRAGHNHANDRATKRAFAQGLRTELEPRGVRASGRFLLPVLMWSRAAFFLAFLVVALAPGATAVDKHTQEVEEAANKLLQVMRNGDVEGLISLLHDKVAFEGDSGMTKRELARQLRRKRGEVYASLFDTRLYSTLTDQWRRRRFSPEERNAMPPVKSVRDYLLSAADIKIRVEFVTGTNDLPKVAVVGFDWPGRPSLSDLPNCTFVRTSRGWKVNDLFSAHAWGFLPPWVKP